MLFELFDAFDAKVAAFDTLVDLDCADFDSLLSESDGKLIMSDPGSVATINTTDE